MVTALAIAGVAAALTLGAPGRQLLPDERLPITATPAAGGLAYEDVQFGDAQSQVLRGWWIPGSRACWGSQGRW